MKNDKRNERYRQRYNTNKATQEKSRIDNKEKDIIDNDQEEKLKDLPKSDPSIEPPIDDEYNKPDTSIPIPERYDERPEGARTRRTIASREVDRTKIIRLMARGYSKAEIARELKISYMTVDKDYKAVLKEMREDREELAKEMIEAKLLEYREIKREAWDAWERSKSSHITTKTKESVVGGMAGKVNYENSQTTETRTGDNSFLAVVLECLKAEREIQGLDPEKKMRLTGEIINWDILASGVPTNGPVPDLIEEEIRKSMELDNKIMNGVEDNTIYVNKEGLVERNNQIPTLEELENMNLATEPHEKEE